MVSRIQAMERLRTIVESEIAEVQDNLLLPRMMWKQHHANSILLNATLVHSLLFYLFL